MNLAGETLKSPEAKRFPGFLLFLVLVGKSDFEAVFEENRGGKPVFYTKILYDGIEESAAAGSTCRPTASIHRNAAGRSSRSP